MEDCEEKSITVFLIKNCDGNTVKLLLIPLIYEGINGSQCIISARREDSMDYQGLGMGKG